MTVPPPGGRGVGCGGQRDNLPGGGIHYVAALIIDEAQLSA